ncbi:EF-hand domain-containing protein [Ochrovirga pacifica]|uniref:EF-hand domain-containing protein n=1 Tax=Ochrovirga pacifica TaxID=1042376 RepID=UPI000255A53E|nr:EF-hand domain-containing protein [Ochrovirga pacifica]
MKTQKTIVYAAFAAIVLSAGSIMAQEKQKPSPEQVFKKFDKNKDGKLTKEELEGKKILERFDKIDKDKNGTISLEEFVKSRTPKKKKPASEE